MTSPLVSHRSRIIVFLSSRNFDAKKIDNLPFWVEVNNFFPSPSPSFTSFHLRLQVDYSRNGFRSSFSKSEDHLRVFHLIISLINITIQSSAIQERKEISLKYSTLTAIRHAQHSFMASTRKLQKTFLAWFEGKNRASDNLSCKFSSSFFWLDSFLTLKHSEISKKSFLSLSLFWWRLKTERARQGVWHYLPFPNPELVCQTMNLNVHILSDFNKCRKHFFRSVFSPDRREKMKKRN